MDDADRVLRHTVAEVQRGDREVERWRAYRASVLREAIHAGVTVLALADALGVTRPTIYRWLRDHGDQ